MLVHQEAFRLVKPTEIFAPVVDGFEDQSSSGLALDHVNHKLQSTNGRKETTQIIEEVGLRFLLSETTKPLFVKIVGF
jgi:hypothetical protein